MPIDLRRIAGVVEPWRWLLFIAAVVLFTTGDVRQALTYAHQKFSNMPRADWEVTNVWLTAAECMRQTGAWLAMCADGKLAPIANSAIADDPGHAFLLGLAAVALDRQMVVYDVAVLNVAIDLAALVFVAALLVALRSYIASLVVLLYGGGVYLAWVAISPHPAVIGAAAFAATLPITILASELRLVLGVQRILFLLLSALAFGIGTMLREPVGTMGIVICLVTLGFLGWRSRSLRSTLRLTPYLVLAVVAWQTPRFVLLARDAIFPVPATTLLQTHGTSHNLYLGLGAVPNKFGVEWADSAGGEAVAKVDPKIGYASQDYFRTLWKIYFQRLADDPAEVARIYVIKLGAVLSHELPERTVRLWVSLLALLIVLLIAFRFHLWRLANYPQGLVVTCIGLGFVAFFVLQGVLAHHSIGYAQPIGAFVLLFLAVGVELLARLAFIAGTVFLAMRKA